MMQATNRRTNVVQIISKQMTVVHDQFKKKGEGKYFTHSTLYTIHYTQYVTHNTLYTIHYTQYTQYLTLTLA